jgi:hypothetical protein
MKAVFLFTFALLTGSFLTAAPSFDPELSGLPAEWKYSPTKLEIIDSATGAMSLSWYGQTGLTYFIQYTEDLQTWNFFPVVEAGHNEVISYGYQSTGPRFFVRLRALDAFSSGAPWVTDSDGDGIPDYWELVYGFNPFDSSDGSGQLAAYQRQILSVGKAPETANALGLLVYTP